MKKIVIYGAGQVGTTAVMQIISGAVKSNSVSLGTEVVMYSPKNHKRVEGALLDMEDATFMWNHTCSWLITATDDVAKMISADAVFFCAGDFPTFEEYQAAEEKGILGGLLQAEKNLPIVKSFAENVKQYCPAATVFVVSNPVDMLSGILRQELPNHQIYGLGCSLDSSRFKLALWYELNGNGYSFYEPDKLEANIIGHHSRSQFLHEASFNFPGKDKYSADELQTMVDAALSKSRVRGSLISKTNVKAATPKANNGAYIAPAVMVAKVMMAFASIRGCDEIVMNRIILPEEAKDSGLAGKYAQMLCSVGEGNVKPLPMQMSDTDISNLATSIEVYEKSCADLENYLS